ncbi:hypothetical protein JCM19992_15010 [Thermostilla marina]
MQLPTSGQGHAGIAPAIPPLELHQTVDCRDFAENVKQIDAILGILRGERRKSKTTHAATPEFTITRGTGFSFSESDRVDTGGFADDRICTQFARLRSSRGGVIFSWDYSSWRSFLVTYL